MDWLKNFDASTLSWPLIAAAIAFVAGFLVALGVPATGPLDTPQASIVVSPE